MGAAPVERRLVALSEQEGERARGTDADQSPLAPARIRTDDAA
jgi:hypothetical protein